LVVVSSSKASELRNFSHWTSWVNDLRRYADTPEIDQRKRMEVKILAEALGFRECQWVFRQIGFDSSLTSTCRLVVWDDPWMTG